MHGLRGALGAIMVVVLLWAIALFVTAAYYVPHGGITYTTVLTWRRMVGLFPLVGWPELAATTGPYDAAFWASLAVVVFGVHRLQHSGRRKAGLAFLGPLILLFPLNALAVVAMVVGCLFPEQYDGEFLAEGWPQNYVYAVWTILALLLGWRAVRQAKTRQGAPT
jgi:hypothetical protein